LLAIFLTFQTPSKRKAKDDLMLIWIPKTWHGQLTLNNLAKLRTKEAMHSGWSGIQPLVERELGEQSIPKSYWALATKKIIPGSRKINRAQEQGLFDVLSQRVVFACNLPNALEAGVCSFLECLSRKDNGCSGHKEGVCSDRFDYTVCQERIQDQQVIVVRLALKPYGGSPMVSTGNSHNTIRGATGCAILKMVM